MILLLCNMFPIGLLQGRGYICGMMIIMMMLAIIGLLEMMMMINFLSGTMVIKSVRSEKHKLKRS